jgi:hypothetical protein
MQRVCSFFLVGLAILLAGCSSVGDSSASADPLKTVDLEFLNGHANSAIPMATDERYTVCSTADCRPVLFWVNIGWPLANKVTRRAPAGEIFIAAKCSGAIAGGRRVHSISFSFLAAEAHTYRVTVANNSGADNCAPAVQDEATGAFVPLDQAPG